METQMEKAYAKLNISLDVLSKRADGYHDMRMVMQSVSLSDDVSVTLREDGAVRAATNLRFLPSDDRNIAVKAAKAFFSRLGRNDSGADISIFKRIPVCSGMGGGSSDGAAVLRALNELTGKPFTRAELESLGASLGSDVPFCVAGGTSLAEGRGEVLCDLPAFPDCRFVIAKPRFSISTPELFSKIDLVSVKYHPDTQGLVASLNSGDLKGVCRRMYNVFEDVLPPKPNDVPVIKSFLLDSGALGAVMTGTGSAVFGIFDNEEKARRAFSLLSGRYTEVFLAEPQGPLAI
ncbi:MAG: 4-(cytidine 5'-diphospho)-2-C-methyl-D-erythritol kinase [Oscillospiraceae bacterium]|nr:4-(cytidine 5'-diphospho)-2-C-methyl-D-erythritol kinase [Oscillospiraceae bacterium]